jgi:hypothetical protein
MSGSADEYFIICNTKTEINVRRAAKRSSEKIGWLECGDRVETDGVKKNGFVYCYDMNTESGDGWVYAGYLVPDKPEKYGGRYVEVKANGRVACRQYVNGKRQGWVNDGQEVKVYAVSAEWAATNKGFIKTEYLEFGGN